MDIKEFASNPRTISAVLAASRYVPDRVGHRIARFAANIMARLEPKVYQVARANLHQVLGPDVEPQILERTARHVFYISLRGYFDLFRAMHLPRDELVAQVDIPDETKDVARSLWNQETGSVMAFPHLGSFDLGGQAIAPRIPEMQLFTLPDPPPGFALTNELRERSGVDVTPSSPAAVRQAIKLLRRGGIVGVAGDRPVSELDEPVSFFGRPARVPSGHVRLALKTGARVVMAYCVISPQTNRHTMHLEPPLEMIRTGNREEEMALNMRLVLGELERIITTWLDQWQMFVPVWPELLET